MKLTPEILKRVLAANPDLTSEQVERVVGMLGQGTEAQLIFATGEGCDVVAGKHVAPVLLTVSIESSAHALELARRLIVYAQDQENGQGRGYPWLSFSGDATFSE